MITRVRVKNFKSLADVDVTLGPLTVLVGRNGAGKSAFLDCLRFLREGVDTLNNAITSRGGFNHICKRSLLPSSGIEIRLNVEDADISCEYFVRIADNDERNYFVAEEKAIFKQHSTQHEVWFERKDMTVEMRPAYKGWADDLGLLPEPQQCFLPFLRGAPEYRYIHKKITEMFFWNVDLNELRPPQRSRSHYVLFERGSNLAPVLEQLKQQDHVFRSLLVDFQHLIPGIMDISVEALGADYSIVKLKHTQENGQEAWFELSQESDGTIRALALLAAVYSMPELCLLAIEEPELALYPDALGLISDILRESALRNQVLFTTQSPDLIARFGADELRVVENKNGATSIGPLAAHQRQVLEEEIFNAGDLLRIEGLHTAPVIVPDLANA